MDHFLCIEIRMQQKLNHCDKHHVIRYITSKKEQIYSTFLLFLCIAKMQPRITLDGKPITWRSQHNLQQLNTCTKNVPYNEGAQNNLKYYNMYRNMKN